MSESSSNRPGCVEGFLIPLLVLGFLLLGLNIGRDGARSEAVEAGAATLEDDTFRWITCECDECEAERQRRP